MMKRRVAKVEQANGALQGEISKFVRHHLSHFVRSFHFPSQSVSIARCVDMYLLICRQRQLAQREGAAKTKVNYPKPPQLGIFVSY
jgi:hypothetical protein